MLIAAVPSKKELEDLRDKGYTRPEIADLYNVNLSQVKRWIAEYGLGKRIERRPKIRSAPVHRGILLHADEGLTVVDIAKRHFGDRMSYCRIRGYLLDGRPRNVDDIVKMAGAQKVD